MHWPAENQKNPPRPPPFQTIQANQTKIVSLKETHSRMNNSPSNGKSSKKLLNALLYEYYGTALSILQTSSIPKNLSLTTHGVSTPVLKLAAFHKQLYPVSQEGQENYQDQAKVVEKLLELGFDPKVNKFLKLVFENLPFSTFKKAVEAGASISDIEGFDTGKVSTDSYPDFEDKVVFALEKGLDKDKILSSAIDNNNQKLIFLLVKNGVDLTKEIKDKKIEKMTPLLRAIVKNRGGVVQLLLMLGATPSSRDLYYAAALGLADIVNHLVKAGAKPDEQVMKVAKNDQIRFILLHGRQHGSRDLLASATQSQGGRRKRRSSTKKGKRHGKKTRKGSK